LFEHIPVYATCRQCIRDEGIDFHFLEAENNTRKYIAFEVKCW